MEHPLDNTPLWLYGDLSPEERRDVEAFVDAHPDYAASLAEARHLWEVVHAARLLERPADDDDLLAYFLATRHFAHGPLPAPLEAAFGRVRSALDADPDLQARFAALRERLEAITAAAADPFEQFAELTGHRLEPVDAPASPERPLESPPPAPDRPARMPRGRRRPLAWAASAVFALVALYAVLALISWTSTSDLERLGLVDPDALAVEGYLTPTRGGEVELPTTDELYLDGLTRLEDAYETTLGLFPRYDDAELVAAAERLEQVLTDTADDPSGFVRLEAAFYLAKIRLYQVEPEDARPLLEQVVANEGRHADEAAELLGAIADR